MNLEFSSWFGVVAPSKVPADTSREEFSRIIAADTEARGKAVAATGFKAD